MQKLARKSVLPCTCSFFYSGTEQDSFKFAITRHLVRDVVSRTAIKETHFGLFINFNENSSDISVPLSHITIFSHIPRRNWGVCHIVGRAFSFSVEQKSVSCVISHRVKSFRLTIIFKFVAHKILLQH
jgi:hypothetical protein